MSSRQASTSCSSQSSSTIPAGFVTRADFQRLISLVEKLTADVAEIKFAINRLDGPHGNSPEAKPTEPHSQTTNISESSVLEQGSERGNEESDTTDEKERHSYVKGKVKESEIIQDYVKNQLGKQVKRVKADGHCMIHAFSLGLEEKDGQGEYSEELLLTKIEKEFSDNRQRYSKYGGINDEDLKAYIKDKKYDSGVVDLIPVAVANITNTSISILEVQNGQVETTPIPPTKKPPEAEERTIHVYKFDNHYDAILERDETGSGFKTEEDTSEGRTLDETTNEKDTPGLTPERKAGTAEVVPNASGARRKLQLKDAPDKGSFDCPQDPPDDIPEDIKTKRQGLPPGSFRCGKDCLTCPYISHGLTTYTFFSTRESRLITSHMTCETENLIYMIQCKRCNLQYIGKTKRRLKDRFDEHLRTVDNPQNKSQSTGVPKHFMKSRDHTSMDMQLIPIEKVSSGQDLGARETYFKRKGKTVHPHGLNLR